MYQVTLATNSTGSAQRYGWLPINGQPSPFLDIRLRQALAMAVNRDEYIDAFSNVSKFEAAGLPVDTYYYTSQGYVPVWTLDPRDAGTFGDNAKYFQYNMDEAKSLFDAAAVRLSGRQVPADNVSRRGYGLRSGLYQPGSGNGRLRECSWS